MKKITYIIQDCAHCNLIDFDGTRYFCTHPKMKRIAVIPMVKDAIHSDCPLEDDLPESKGSERGLLISYTRWLALGELYVDRYIKEVEPYFPKQSKSDDWIPASRIRDKIKTYELHFNIIKDQQSSIFKEEGETCKRVIGVLKSLLPAVPQEEKGEK